MPGEGCHAEKNLAFWPSGALYITAVTVRKSAVSADFSLDWPLLSVYA